MQAYDVMVSRTELGGLKAQCTTFVEDGVEKLSAWNISYSVQLQLEKRTGIFAAQNPF